MHYPKLKYPRICRILTYIVVIGFWALPAVVVCLFPVPDILKAVTILGCLMGFLVYIVKNFIVLMAMDTALATLSCYRTAQKQYTLPKSRTPEAIRHSILRFGTSCDPVPYTLQPSALRYRFSSPLTMYTRGIERVVAAYEVDQLDRETYRSILSSAKTNSKTLTGRKKALFLDSTQKKAPLHRVTVVPILAHSIDPQMTADLYDLVCKQCGDEEKDCVVPCVIDLTQRTCVFNCVRVP